MRFLRVNYFLTTTTLAILAILIFFASIIFVFHLTKPKPVKIRADSLESSLPKEDLGALADRTGSNILGTTNKVEIVKEFPARKTAFGYNAIVVNWKESLDEESEVTVQVSTSDEGRIWSGWKNAEKDPDSDGKEPPAEGENFSNLIVAEGNFIKYRLRVLTDPKNEGTVEKIKLIYIDSEESFWEKFWRNLHEKVAVAPNIVKGSFAATTSRKPTDRPNIISRSRWGADPKLMRWGPEYRKIKKMFVHHTVTLNAGSNPAATVRAIYYFHSVVRKWGDIGYNYLADSKGNIYEGRYGGDGVVGGHVYHYNYGSVGVAVIGDYRTAYPTKAAKNALQQIAVWKSTSHGFDPAGRSRFGSPGYEYTFANVTNHGDVGDTECAGKNLNNFVPLLRTLARQMPLEVLALYKNGSLKRVAFSKNRLATDVLRDLRRSSTIALVQPNYIRKQVDFPDDPAVPDDPLFNSQWYLTKIKQDQAWRSSLGSSGVKVAVLDTGVAYENYVDGSGSYSQLPDFGNTSFDSANAYDFVNGDAHANDDNGHGTAVVSIIAASTNNSLANASIAPAVTILPIKVLNKNGFGIDSDIAKGISWATARGARVINFSFGGPENSYILGRRISSAYSKGAVVVAAAGNNSSAKPFYPAATGYVLGVGATRFDNSRAYYSNYGSWIDLFAPGGDTRVDQNRDGKKDGLYLPTISAVGNNYSNFKYLYMSGTSLAASHVSAVAALAASRGVGTNSLIERTLLRSTRDLGRRGVDNIYRYGLLQATLQIP
ncbi:MAG: S8 family serine peptidase [Candidatus Woykebacteria bacterium]